MRLATLALLGCLVPLLALTASAGTADAAHAAASGHYLPQAGDSFSYFESTLLTNGYGNVSGYIENTYTNGSFTFTGIAPNATVNTTYSWSETCPECQPTTSSDSGVFTWNANNYSYDQGNDLQASEPLTVWFYANNSLGAGGSLSLANTPLTVDSTDQAYTIPGTSTTVSTIFAEGTGTAPDDSQLGDFSAQYTWMAYFDPSTGYLVGYQYIEQDSDGIGDGFTYIDTVSLTHSSFELTTTAAPATDTLTFAVNSGGCSLLFAAGNYTNGQSVAVQPGATYLVTYYPCGATFNTWSLTGGTLGSTTAGTTTVKMTGSGTLTSNFTPAASTFPWLLVILLVVVVLVLIVVIVVAVRAGRRRRSMQGGALPRHGYGGPMAYAPAPPPVYGGPAPINLIPGGQPSVQQIVMKETVKVPCRYCGALMDSTAPTCPQCGAPRT